jgi:hypothetical protein
MYAAQAIPPIDAEIAEKGHLWTETSLCPSTTGPTGRKRRIIFLWFKIRVLSTAKETAVRSSATIRSACVS